MLNRTEVAHTLRTRFDSIPTTPNRDLRLSACNQQDTPRLARWESVASLQIGSYVSGKRLIHEENFNFLNMFDLGEVRMHRH